MERISFLKWIGAVLVVLGTILFLSWDSLLAHMLRPEFVLSPTSQVYQMWVNSTTPIYLDFYLFNVTNTEDLEKEDFKPHLEEIGPYRFEEYQEKVNVTWNDNGTVTYRQKRTWYFDPSNSNGTLKENITMLNILPVTASYRARDWGYFPSWSLSTSLKMFEKSIWTTRTASEFLFEGYHDPLLTLSSLFSKQDLDKVGLMYGRNGTYAMDGYFNMETGQDDMSKIGLIRQWNFQNRTFSYEEGCDAVDGYLGHFFAPNLPTDQPIWFFTGELCKAAELNFVEEVERHGLKGHRYIPKDSLMDNGLKYPEKACDCNGNCFPHGVLNISYCSKGAPMFASFPHFLDADPSYGEKVDGLHPDPTRSDFHIILEPNLGFPMEMAAHIQYNLLLQKNSKLSMFADVPELLVPLMWVRKRVLMPPEAAENIKLVLSLPMIGMSCAIGLVLLGLLLLSFSVLPRFFRKNNSHKELKKSTTITDVSFSKTNGMTFKKGGEEEDNKENILVGEKNPEYDEKNAEKVMKLLGGQETEILT